MALVDLAITGSGGTAIGADSSSGGLLLRITGTGSATYQWFHSYYGAFIIDSSIVTPAAYPAQIGDNTPFLVIKGSTVSRTSSGDTRSELMGRDKKDPDSGQHDSVQRIV